MKATLTTEAMDGGARTGRVDLLSLPHVPGSKPLASLSGLPGPLDTL